MQFVTFSILSVATLVAAQATIDPSTVPDATKRNWCISQQSTCPLLCTQINNGSASYYDNDCNPVDLSYSCVCGNHQSPNSTEYTQTLPYFICTENNNRCVNNCGAGNDQCAYGCRTAHPCGASDPRRYNITSTTASSSKGATAAATATSSAASSANTIGVSVNGNNGGSNQTPASGVSGAVSVVAANVALVAVMGAFMAGTFALL